MTLVGFNVDHFGSPGVTDVEVVTACLRNAANQPTFLQRTSKLEIEARFLDRLTLLRLKLAALLDNVPEGADLTLEAPILGRPVGLEVFLLRVGGHLGSRDDRGVEERAGGQGSGSESRFEMVEQPEGGRVHTNVRL